MRVLADDVSISFSSWYLLGVDDPSPASQTDPAHWTYKSDQPLYPIFDLPKIEKRVVKEVGPDGIERERIVEVKVPRERKRLFLFPGAGRKD